VLAGEACDLRSHLGLLEGPDDLGSCETALAHDAPLDGQALIRLRTVEPLSGGCLTATQTLARAAMPN
jgi:hypothetical protein